MGALHFSSGLSRGSRPGSSYCTCRTPAFQAQELFSFMRRLLNSHPHIACGRESKLFKDNRLEGIYTDLRTIWPTILSPRYEFDPHTVDQVMAWLMHSIFMIYGSGDLVHTLMQQDLIDEYRIWVHPVVLGSGKRLFRDGSDTTVLRLVDTRTFSSGVVVLSYQSAGKEEKK